MNQQFEEAFKTLVEFGRLTTKHKWLPDYCSVCGAMPSLDKLIEKSVGGALCSCRGWVRLCEKCAGNWVSAFVNFNK